MVMTIGNRIILDLHLSTRVQHVCQAISTAEGLQAWWAETAQTTSDRKGFTLTFGPEYTFHAEVVDDLPHARFALRWTDAMPTWEGTLLAFEVRPVDGQVVLRLEHLGWNGATHEMAKTAYHWPFLLRGLKRFLEDGEQLPFAKRGA